MRYTHGKHDEHQRPAATKTIESMADTKIPRRSDATAIMLSQKAERVTADSKALFFKPAELKRACKNEGDSCATMKNAGSARARNRRGDVTHNRRGK